MSYEISIKRASGKPPLTADDFNSLVKEDSSLSGGDLEPIIWTDPTSSQTRYINISPESGELSTDDTQGNESDLKRFLEKLRSIASKLDARMTAEGEDITDQKPTSPPTGGCMSIIVCAAGLIVVIAIISIGFI